MHFPIATTSQTVVFVALLGALGKPASAPRDGDDRRP